jgi:hypothetical protein
MNERLEMLSLIESGQIGVEEGLRRLEALNEERTTRPAEGSGALADEASSAGNRGPRREVVDRVAHIAWRVVFGLGVAVLAGGGLLLADAYRARGTPGLIWGWIVFLLGLAVMLVGWWLRQARWLWLRVREHGRRAFSIAVPLPLSLMPWTLRVARPFVPQLQGAEGEALIETLERELRAGGDFEVHVDEGAGGDQVDLYVC